MPKRTSADTSSNPSREGKDPASDLPRISEEASAIVNLVGLKRKVKLFRRIFALPERS